MTTFFIDPENGNDSNDGLSFGNAWLTMINGATAARIAPGDTIRIKSSPLPTLLGSCTFTNDSEYITIPSGVAKLLTDCEATTDWTASTYNTISVSSSRWINGTYSIANTITSSFTTGKFAVYDFGSNLDLSDFRQLNLFIKVATTDIPATNLVIKLCSDAAGDTEIDANHVFEVPFLLDVSYGFYRTVLSHPSGNLSSSVRSISFWIANASQGATTVVYLDNIFVTKDNASNDGFNLHSLLSKTNNITDIFDNDHDTKIDACPIPIRALNTDTQIRIDANKNGYSTTAIIAKFFGTSESVNTYIYRPFLETGDITSGNHGADDSGSSWSNKIVFSGGWNATDMSTQDNISLFAGITGGISLGINTTKNYVTFERLGYSNIGRFQGLGWNCTLTGQLMNEILLVNSDIFHYSQSDWYGGNTKGMIFRNIVAAYLSQEFMDAYAGGHYCPIFENCLALVNGYPSARHCFNMNYPFANYKNCAAVGSYRGYGFYQVGDVHVDGFNFSDCLAKNNYSGDLYVAEKGMAINFTMGSSNEVDVSGYCNRFTSQTHDGTTNNDIIFGNGHKVTKQNSVTQPGSGYALKVDVTSSTIISSVYPVLIPLGAVLCTSGVSKSVTAYLRRTNTGLTLGLMVEGSVTDDMQDELSPMTAAADTWEQVTLTFTPNMTGLVPIYAYAYGGTTYSGYIDTIGV